MSVAARTVARVEMPCISGRTPHPIQSSILPVTLITRQYRVFCLSRIEDLGLVDILKMAFRRAVSVQIKVKKSVIYSAESKPRCT